MKDLSKLAAEILASMPPETRFNWEWQVFIGLVHVKQKATTAMVMAMRGWLLKNLRLALKTELPQQKLAASLIH